MTNVPVPSVVSELVARHLDPEAERRWLALLRPAVELQRAGPGVTGPVLGRVGGVPDVPADFDWPVRPGRGPLSFLAQVDLAALAASGLETGLELPRTGRLLAFLWIEDEGTDVGTWDPQSLVGARLVHVTSEALRPAAVPAGAGTAEAADLLGRQLTTWCSRSHVLRREVGDLPDDLHNALLYLDIEDGPAGQGTYQLGGWIHVAQEDAESYVEELTGGGERGWDEVLTASERWRPLLSMGATGHLMFGDGLGCWLTADQGEVRVEDAVFTYDAT